jgi:hypothetical protein
MVDSLFRPIWRLPPRIVALALVLGVWISAVVPGCSSKWLAARAHAYLSETITTLNPEENDDTEYTYFE